MITRRRFFASALATFAPLAAYAQKAEKVFRVGILSGAKRPSEADLRRALGELGYIEGRNTIFESRDAEGKTNRLDGFAVELVRLKVDVIVTAGGPAAEAAKRATSTIPIVIWGVGDPVGIGLLTNVAHPGGNITGVTELSTELTAKRLQLLRELIPTVSRVAVLWNSTDRSMTLRYREAENAAPGLGMTMLPVAIRDVDDFDGAFATIARNLPDAVLVVTDPLTRLKERSIIEFLTTHRLPSMYEFGVSVRQGALIAYGPSIADLAPRAAYFVHRILRGANPGDLPLEQPRRYYLVLNLKTAAGLGLNIPQSVLLRADEVIK